MKDNGTSLPAGADTAGAGLLDASAGDAGHAYREALDACACFNFRKAARSITRFFDEALEPSGLRSTQLAILLAAGTADSPSITSLAQQLVMDSSTLVRNIRPMAEEELVKITQVPGSRRKIVLLTKKGQKKIALAVPLWETAQRAVTDHFSDAEWSRLRQHLAEAVEITRS